MSPAAPELAVRPAAIELTALAVAVRPDWPEDVVTGTLRRAADDGMTWPQVLTTLPRLMADPLASPADLLPNSRNPFVKKAGTLPPSEYRRLREARAETERRRAAADIPPGEEPTP